METTLSTINQFPSGKEQMQLFFRSVKSEILANDKDPLKILIQLKYVEKVIENILSDKDIEYHFLKEFNLYEAEKVVEMLGAKLSVMEAGVKYDYNSCGDPVWFDLDKQITELTEKKKERESFLKALPQEGTVDPVTGVFINRPPKTSKTKVQVRL